MVHASRDVTKALRKKGFARTDRTDEEEYEFEGTLVRTHVSNGGNHDIAAFHRKMMAGQMHLKPAEFDEFVSCTLTKERYREILEEKARL